MQSIIIIIIFLQGNKDVKSPKSPVADIPTGGTRSIKSMWEKGNVGSTSESPSPANKVTENETERGLVWFSVSLHI